MGKLQFYPTRIVCGDHLAIADFARSSASVQQRLSLDALAVKRLDLYTASPAKAPCCRGGRLRGSEFIRSRAPRRFMRGNVKSLHVCRACTTSRCQLFAEEAALHATRFAFLAWNASSRLRRGSNRKGLCAEASQLSERGDARRDLRRAVLRVSSATVSDPPARGRARGRLGSAPTTVREASQLMTALRQLSLQPECSWSRGIPAATRKVSGAALRGRGHRTITGVQNRPSRARR